MSADVQLVLSLERTAFAITEPVRPGLQVLNRGAAPVTFDGGFVFDWERLGFAPPNAVHLLAPDGTDLARPYRRDAAWFTGVETLRVEPGGEEWRYLPLYAHLHLRDPGEHTFWVALADTGGRVHESNRLRFALHDVPASLPPGRVGLTLAAAGGAGELEAVFTNRHDAPVAFLRPQEDSFYGWVNPVYQFTVTDHAGRGLALPLRSGSMASPDYGGDRTVVAAPGESVRQPLRLPRFPEMRAPGSYTVRLTYVVRDRAIGKGGVVLDRPMEWGPEVYLGRLESNTLALTPP